MSISAELEQQLLTRPNDSDLAALLQAANLLTQQGANDLLDAAANALRTNIPLAEQFALAATVAASASDAADVLPEAHYLAAQSAAMQGAFPTALDRILTAQTLYRAATAQQAVWRTTLGLIAVYAELGRYAEGVATADHVLARLPADADEAVRNIRARLHQNRASCLYQLGDYENMLLACYDANRDASALDLSQREQLQNNRGMALLGLGRVSEAATVFDRLLSDADADERPYWTAQIELNRGYASLAAGDYMDAVRALDRARMLYAGESELVDAAIADLDSAETYLALNLYDEAQTRFEAARDWFESAEMPYEYGRALLGLGAVAAQQAALAQAQPLLETAQAQFEAIGNVSLQVQAWLELAAVYQAQQDALANFALSQAARLTEQHHLPQQALFVACRAFDFALAAGDLAAAAEHLDDLATNSQPLPLFQYHVLLRKGQLQRRWGNVAGATVTLHQAIATLEQMRGTLVQEALRTSFLRDKMAAFQELLDLYLQQDNDASLHEAFAVAEQAKARTLVDKMVGAVDNRLLAGLSDEDAKRLQGLRADLNALYNQLLRGLGEERGRRVKIEQHAKQIEQEIGRIYLDHRTDETDLFAPAATPASDALLEQLPSEVPVIAYHALGDELFAFVFSDGQLHTVRSLTTVSKVTRLIGKLQAQWGYLQTGRAFASQHLHQFERTARRVLNMLYRVLFAPLERYLPNNPAQPLVIVPHGVLHQLPFHALHDGSIYLIDRLTISYAPSVAVYALCQGASASAVEHAVVFSVSDPTLPKISAEVEQIHHHLPTVTHHADADATRAQLMSVSNSADVLHLACHGVFRSDNPLFSALQLSDSWITAHDIGQMQAVPPLVVLSACESGRNRVIAGDETLGLTRAFFGAGARTILASLWLVQDDITAELMADWYAHLNGDVDHATALRNVQRVVKQRFPHPYYWAPFQLLGRR